MTRYAIIFAMAAMPAVASAQAAEQSPPSAYDKIWSTLTDWYSDQDNPVVQRVLFTGRNMQLVLMTLRPGEEIGLETHGGHDQFIRVEAGTGERRRWPKPGGANQGQNPGRC